MDTYLKILLVEDLDSDAEIMIRFLKREKINFVHERVWTREDFEDALDIFDPDLIISDHSLPGFSGMEAFHILKKAKKNTPFILTTGTVSEKLLTQYMKEGLDDYILKENLLRLPSAIERVLNRKKIENLHTELMLANTRLESAYHEMRDSINYASRIQRAILPGPDEMKRACRDHFVLYKPKAVVSGDFYWCTTATVAKTKQEISLVAAVDCTGHGVPGAFMSMLGHALLNQTVNDPNVTSPADVLDFLNKELPKNIKSHEQHVSLRDGMDISLCAIDYDAMELHFSGANNSCLISRDYDVIELKANKQAISAAHDVEKKNFSNQKFSLKKGDTVYLYTDGYADQFGGPDGKKYMRKNFKNLINSIQFMSLEDQKAALEREFEEWKGRLEQIDDVLVVGIRV